MKNKMPDATNISAVAEVIKLSVAPVFLLSGIGSLLSVMTSRLARVVDRARSLESQLKTLDVEKIKVLKAELDPLSRRARHINRAIALCTMTALLICTVIAVLFLGAYFNFDPSTAIALLFVSAMLAIFLGLLSFLCEVFVATASLRIDPHKDDA